jgi:hypothetical protein
MKTSTKHLLLIPTMIASLGLIMPLIQPAQAQFHYETISIGNPGGNNSNNPVQVIFIPTVNGTGTVTQVSVSPTSFVNSTVIVGVSTNWIPIYYADYLVSCLFETWAGMSITGFVGGTNGSTSFEVCAGTAYYLSGFTNSLGGSYQATVSYPVLDYFYSITNGAITITEYIGPGGAVTIPSAIDVGVGCISHYLPVTSIDYGGFWGDTTLTSVTIPDSVTNIGNGVFSLCGSLSSVTTGDGVTVIDDYAFQSCSNLASLRLGNRVTSIGAGAFEHCTNLTTVTIPNSVVNLGSDSFWDCSKLTNLNLGNNLTNIADAAFYKCYSLTGVTIPNSVRTIEHGAFGLCSNLTSVTIPASVTNITGVLFAGCTNMPNIMVDPLNSYYSSIGGVLFDKAGTALMEYPSGKSASTYTIPSRVTNIVGNAFGICPTLTSVCFAGNAPSYAGNVFYQDFALSSVYYVSGTTGWGSTFSGIPTTPCAQCAPNVPVLQTPVIMTNSKVLLTWAAPLGATCQLQYKTNLNQPNWINIGSPVLASNIVVSVTNAIGSDKQRFYRVQQQ